MDRLVGRIVRTADVPDSGGVRVMRLALGTCAAERVIAGAARALRDAGFVSVCLDAPRPERLRAGVLHRHVVLFGGECDEEAAVVWIRQLSAASPRAHLVVLFSQTREAQLHGASIARERAVARGWPVEGPEWASHYARVARRAEALIRAGEWRAASAALQSLTAEADVTRSELPPEFERWQSFVNSACGRTAMNPFYGVTSLWDAVQDATDEYSALRHGCSWVREHAGADGAGIVSGDSPRLIAGEGISASDLEEPDVRAAMSMPGGRGGTVVAEGARAVVMAPMRYGGATIGFAFARGSRDDAESLDGAARALASACAPALRARLDGLALSAASHTRIPEILGRSPSIGILRDATTRAAGTMFPVLIEGESGTGKELVARALHRLSPRRDRRFAAINCAALTDELVEAELFGHTRGAFTGAISHRAGLFEESHGSTLFLDEVAELSPRAQAKLLRVLQEREVRRVGEHVARPVDVRVVAATNAPLARAVTAGKFREDLLFRLAVVRIRVPPLRDRVEDIPLLAYAFWRSISGEMRAGQAAPVETRKQAVLGPDAVAALCRHGWPGNVRELQNVIAALMVEAPTRGRVTARHVHRVLAGCASVDNDSSDATLEHAREVLERRMISAALARHRGRRTEAARELGLSRQGLAKAMKRLGFELVARRRPASTHVLQLSPQAQ